MMEARKMSADDLVRAAGRAVSRRTILRRIGTGALATVGMLVGVQGVAQASYRCCNLCYSASRTCPNCKCYWCWTCCQSHNKYRCCECHTALSNCGDNCTNVHCSIGVPIAGTC